MAATPLDEKLGLRWVSHHDWFTHKKLDKKIVLIPKDRGKVSLSAAYSFEFFSKVDRSTSTSKVHFFCDFSTPHSLPVLFSCSSWGEKVSCLIQFDREFCPLQFLYGPYFLMETISGRKTRFSFPPYRNSPSKNPCFEPGQRTKQKVFQIFQCGTEGPTKLS